MKKQYLYRGLFYIAGLLILAFGLTLNTKTGLGVSAILSVSFSVSSIWNLNFGDITLVLYIVFVIVELILHLKNQERKLTFVMDLLQIPLSIFFTRFLNIFSAVVPDFASAYPNRFLGSFWGRIIFLLLAIALTAVGICLSLSMRLIPNPGDGIVQAIADTAQKSVGLTKNFVDAFSICITIIISLLFAGHLVGIGLGTVLAVIGTGRMVDVVNHFCYRPMVRLAGLERP